MKIRSNLALLASLCALAACASWFAPPTSPPEPQKPVEGAELFHGRWFEIARTPTRASERCVAGTIDYLKTVDGVLLQREACRDRSPEGREISGSGPVTFLTADGAKFQVRNQLLGVLTTDRTYWVLDHDPTYRWVILSDPQFKRVSAWTRAPRPSAEEVSTLTARVAQLGYDPGNLEFPTRFASGEGASPR